MQWELTTALEFGEAVKQTKVCIVPLGVLERHGDHLPVGTDFLNAHLISLKASEQEPAMVFPPIYFGQISEARCFPGTIALRPELLTAMLQNIVDEIARNGFEKIIFYNFHGGNWYWLKFFIQNQRYEPKPYLLYLYENLIPREVYDVLSTDPGHACEWETSIMLTKYPEYVRMENVPEQPAVSMARLSHLPFTETSMSWYSCFPEQYAGDARAATAEKGQTLVDIMSQHLAAHIRQVKEDTVLKQLSDEFFERVAKLGKDE